MLLVLPSRMPASHYVWHLIHFNWYITLNRYEKWMPPVSENLFPSNQVIPITHSYRIWALPNDHSMAHINTHTSTGRNSHPSTIICISIVGAGIKRAAPYGDCIPRYAMYLLCTILCEIRKGWLYNYYYKPKLNSEEHIRDIDKKVKGDMVEI